MTDLTTTHADVLQADRKAADEKINPLILRLANLEHELHEARENVSDIDAELARREDAQPTMFAEEPPRFGLVKNVRLT